MILLQVVLKCVDYTFDSYPHRFIITSPTIIHFWCPRFSTQPKNSDKLSALTVNPNNDTAIHLYIDLWFVPVDEMVVYMKACKFTRDENQ